MRFAIYALALVGLFIGGCAGFKSANNQEFNLITTSKTPLFKTGPYQSTPPDLYLEAGSRIRMIRAEGEYVQVETISGVMGYISSRDVGPDPN